jgi:hypothetical protein
MPDLKKVLTELSNRLVSEYGFDPPNKSASDHSTYAVLKLTEYLNRVTEAREVLKELGYDWPITIKDRKQSEITTLRFRIERAETCGCKEEEVALRRELDKLLGIQP